MSDAPVLTVERGEPTDEELAAVTLAVLLVARQARAGQIAPVIRSTTWREADTYRAPGSWVQGSRR